jgi:hypothetical protein
MNFEMHDALQNNPSTNRVGTGYAVVQFELFKATPPDVSLEGELAFIWMLLLVERRITHEAEKALIRLHLTRTSSDSTGSGSTKPRNRHLLINRRLHPDELEGGDTVGV